MKVRLNGERHFLTAGYQYTRCEQGAGAREALAGLISAYYARLSQESPVQMMTEKCRRLIEGRSDVVFDEYTDLDMMEPVSYTHLLFIVKNGAWCPAATIAAPMCTTLCAARPSAGRPCRRFRPRTFSCNIKRRRSPGAFLPLYF